MLSFVLLFINTFYLVDQVSASPSPLNSPEKSTDNFIFSAPLIHRRSRESPFFDPSYNRDAHIEDGVNTSLARAHYFSQMKASAKDYVSAPISGWSLLMKFFIGTPPVVGYGVFDTGSTFTWIQCRPCIDCIKQDYPLFDSRHSSSFQKLICSDNRCQMGPATSCGSSLAVESNLCLYYITYWDTSTSRGIVSTETITLSAENTSRTEKSVVFGCGNDNESEGYPGVVGLGKGGSSLLNQFSISHFSYYVFANGDDIHGAVHFGPGASLSHLGMTTPILSNDQGIYFLNLTGISVDGSDLEFPRGVFEMGTDEDGNSLGLVIDSGSTYTMLPSEVYDVFKSAIMEAMYEYTPESTASFELCYRDVSGAPEIVFQFSGLDYILCDANLWMKHSGGLYCLAVLRLKESVGKLSTLGFHQQRNVQVGFDLEKNLLSLVYPGACPDDVDFVSH